MQVRQEKDRMIVDIHGLRVRDAEARLLDWIARCDPQTRQIVVIHGCNGGQALRDMVRTLHAPRLAAVRPDFFNDGQTILEMRPKP